jgi:hypothetical protein
MVDRVVPLEDAEMFSTAAIPGFQWVDEPTR